MSRQLKLPLVEAMSYEDRRAAIYAALSSADSKFSPEIVETHDDYVIVHDWQSEPQRHYRIAYTVAEDDSITLGERVEVEVTYKPVTQEAARGLAAGGDLDVLREVTRLTEATAADADGKVWRVTIIRPGWSENNRYYSRDVLAGAARLVEGAKAYADHPTETELRERPERSVRDIVGHYSGARQEGDGRVTADLHVLESAAWLKAILREAPRLVGISINALGKTSSGIAEGRSGVLVDAIGRIQGADVVTEPAAGGSIDRLVASKRRETEDVEFKDITLEALRQNRPDLVKVVGEQVLKEARPAAEEAVKPLREALEAAQKTNAALGARVVQLEARDIVSARLGKSNLPEAARARVRQLVEASTPLKADGALDVEALDKQLGGAIIAEQEYIKQVGGSAVRGAGAGDVTPGAVVTEAATKAEAALDAAFGIQAPAAVAAK